MKRLGLCAGPNRDECYLTQCTKIHRVHLHIYLFVYIGVTMLSYVLDNIIL